MATDPKLRDLFRGDTPELRAIDTASVIRRSKTRRLPAQVGIGGVFTLAIGGLGVAGLQGLGGTLGGSQSASDSTALTTEQGPVLPGDGTVSGLKRAPADRINLCGGTLADVAPSQTGLVLTVAFPDSPVGTDPVTGTVTLVNTGSNPIVGYTTPSPAITLSQGGIVLWHSNGMMIQSIQDVSLAPGESLELAASFTPVSCGIENDAADGFPADLPPVAAGEYQLSAAADVTIDGNAELVVGPTQTVRIG